MDAVTPNLEANNEIYVLKRGEILGPFTVEDLRAGLESGQFVPRDFVQQGGIPIWQPMSRFLDPSPASGRGAVAPDWHYVLSWLWVRLRQDVAAGSFLVGLLAAVIGAIVVLLSRWPLSLSIPWFLIPVAAALFAMKQGRALAGLGLLLLVAAVPVGFSFLPRVTSTEPVVTIAKTEPVVSRSTPTAPPEAEVEASSTPPPPVEAESAPAPTPALVAKLEEPPAPVVPKPAPPVTAAVAASPVPASTAMALPKELPPLPALKSSTAPESDSPVNIGDLVQRYSGALILVKGAEGSGSGFVCKADGQIRLVTNIHVVAGMKQPQFTALNGTHLTVATPEAAVGRDIFRTTVNAPPAAALDLIDDLESKVKIGDDVVVLGNSGGGGVVTRLEGKLVGIGPDRIEVSAEFIPGNSGSPIIHVPTGRVIGIATYLTKRYEEFGGKEQAVRRFGYRVDKVAQWQPVNWAVFQGEAEQLRHIELLTGDVFDFLAALRKNTRSDFATDTLRRPATQWLATVSRTQLSPADRLQATRGFLGSLRAMVRGDVSVAENQLRYDYFRNELSQQREVRDRLYDAFDEQMKQMASTTGRRGY